MRITNQSEYAIRAILEMAKNPGEIHTPGMLYEKIQAPKLFLAKILQRLARKGILKSVRGAAGGFSFKKSLKEITLFDIITAVEGEIALNKCLLDDHICTRENLCPIHPIWVEAQESLSKILSRKSIYEILQGE